MCKEFFPRALSKVFCACLSVSRVALLPRPALSGCPMTLRQGQIGKTDLQRRRYQAKLDKMRDNAQKVRRQRIRFRML